MVNPAKGTKASLSRSSGQIRIGQPVLRIEDAALLKGEGRYIDDLQLPNAAHAYFLRSPYVHADIASIDTSEAAASPGVLAVYMSTDLRAAGIGPMRPVVNPRNRDGSPATVIGRPVLAEGRVRFAGEAVAMVVAATAMQARDAAERIVVDYAERAHTLDPRQALEEDAPTLHEDAKSNVAIDWEGGDRGATGAAFARAAHITRLVLVQNRVSAAPIEPRGAAGEFDAATGRYTLHTPTQGSRNIQDGIASTGIVADPLALRVLTPDVGGSFGMKISPYPEQVAVLFAARQLGRPVTWFADRSESFLADSAGRDYTFLGELALDAAGRFLGVRGRIFANTGAYTSSSAIAIPTIGGSRCITGVYEVPCFHLETKVAFTNTVPVASYRGAGKPEFIYFIERLVDAAARETGRDRVELRRLNMVRPESMPYTAPTGLVFDSGDFQKNLDDALALTNHAGFEERRREAAGRGRLLGYGMSVYQEPDGYYDSHVRLAFDKSGTLTVATSAQANGQGHVTTFMQIASQQLGLDVTGIRIVQGDSDRTGVASGTGGSRETTVTGTAMVRAAKVIVEKGRRIAGHLLEAPATDIEFEVSDEGGLFRISGTDRRISIVEVAKAAHSADLPLDIGTGLEASDRYEAPTYSFPSGCHICEIEIDSETGQVMIKGYAVVNDFGVVVNPLLLEGQVHGGVTQGIGQALMEELVHDPSSGQLLTGSFMDYGLPRADDVPMFGWARNEVPCKTNPLGVKGCGESGVTASLAAVMSGVLDALAPRGITHLDMPATQERIWRALQAAGTSTTTEP